MAGSCCLLVAGLGDFLRGRLVFSVTTKNLLRVGGQWFIHFVRYTVLVFFIGFKIRYVHEFYPIKN